MHAPVRKAPTERRRAIHEEESDTKKVILGDMADEEREESDDERIVCMAAIGKNLHDIYSYKRTAMARTGRAPRC